MKATDDELSKLHQQLAGEIPDIDVPGQMKPSWQEISEGLDLLLTPKEECQNNES
jgi:hypothetical protein